MLADGFDVGLRVRVDLVAVLAHGGEGRLGEVEQWWPHPVCRRGRQGLPFGRPGARRGRRRRRRRRRPSRPGAGGPTARSRWLRRDGDPLDRGDPQVLRRRFDDRTEQRRLDEVAIEDRELGLGSGADVYTSWTAVIASPSVVNRHTPKFDRNIIWRALRIRSSADWCRAAIVCSAENTWSGSASCASTAASSMGRARIGVGRSASRRSSSRGSTHQRQSGGWAGLSRVVSSGRIGSPGRCRPTSRGPAAGPGCAGACARGRGDEVVLGAALGQQHEVIGGPVPAEALDTDPGSEELLQQHRAAVERSQVDGHHVLQPARRELGDPGGSWRCAPPVAHHVARRVVHVAGQQDHALVLGEALEQVLVRQRLERPRLERIGVRAGHPARTADLSSVRSPALARSKMR